MNYKVSIFAAIFYAVFAGNIKANYFDNDTLKTKTEISDSNFENNLDSLLNLWYVKNYIITNPSNYLSPILFDSIPENLLDSIYKKRISDIPSVVELSYNNIVKSFFIFFLFIWFN